MSFTFNDKLKRILSVILFVILLVGALSFCTRLFEDKTPRIENKPFFDAKTNFDVVYFGTSHVYNGILPMEMWQEYGIASYNWGYSNSTPAQNYYLLKEVVKYTDPKVVVIDMNGLVEYEELGNGKYRNDAIMSSHGQFDEFPLSLNKIKAAYDLFDDYDDRADFVWDFIMYHNRWDQLSEKDFDYTLSTEMGAQFQTGRISSGFEPISPDEKMDEINSVCYDYFIKILEFCQEENIKCLCVYLPHPMDETSQRVANSIGDVISQYEGCEYLNMIYEGILDNDTDINIDAGHVNYSGACKTTSFLGYYLASNYELTDYSESEYWYNAYQDYLNYRASRFAEQTSLINYLMLCKNPGLNISLEFYDGGLGSSELINKLLSAASLTPICADNGPEGCCAHIIVTYTDGSIADEAYFAYSADDIVRTVPGIE